MAEDDNKPSTSGRSEAAAESKADSSNQSFVFDIYNVPSTLGLCLEKSESLVNLIQKALEDQANAAANVTNNGNSATGKKRKAVPTNRGSTTDKFKASNFPAKSLKIGDWLYQANHEGDLVAKIYFSKRKLVWEVIESGGRKNKMEILWSDISAIKATCPEDELGTLGVALARRPLFFGEAEPQPRRHTIWQSTTDFTGGRASTYRWHFLRCPSDLLSKNFKKLIQFDEQLNMLSQQSAALSDSPDELQHLMFEDQYEPEMCNAPNTLNKYYPHTSIFADPQFGSTYSMFPTANGLGKASEFVSQAITLPRSGPLPFSPTNTQTVDGHAFRTVSAQYNVHRFQGSVRPDSFVNQMNRGISEKMASCDPSSNNEMLRRLIRCLLDDTQDVQTASDEKFVKSTIDSLRRLIQEHPASAAETMNSDGTSTVNNSYGTNEAPNSSSEVSNDETPTAVSREKESQGDLLTQIPRVASMPQIFRRTSEDSDDRTT